MGWGDLPHCGIADERWPDGRWSGGTHRPGDPIEVVAYRAACECGWRSEQEHPAPLRPGGASLVRDPETGVWRSAGAPEWDAYYAAVEAAESACWQDWRMEHIEPMRGVEPRTQLVLGSDAGGQRHFLDGRPVHAGTTLELLLDDGHWVPIRFEWSLRCPEEPDAYLGLGVPAGARKLGEYLPVKFPLPAGAILRWPERG